MRIAMLRNNGTDQMKGEVILKNLNMAFLRFQAMYWRRCK